MPHAWSFAVLLAVGTAAVPLGPEQAVAASTDNTVDAPVQDLTLPVEDLVFGEANTDGSLVDLGHQELRVDADVLFAFDKADLSPKAAALIEQVVAAVTEQGATNLAVAGHTDNAGGDAYNQALSTRRAQAVRSALAKALGPGVTVTARGFGESKPIADNASDTGRALNRRVEITLG